MVGDHKGKKPTTAAADEDSYEHLDGELVLSIEKLQEIQDELEKINEEATEKVLEIEQKYSEVRRPIYEKRVDIIKEIPAFWKTAFLSHPSLCHLLTEDDEKVFEFLESLDVTDSKDVKYGYSITFSFSPNPYFENEKLVKTVAFDDDDGSMKLTGTNIKWKGEMNLANGVAQTKKGKKRPLVEDSFFTFFSEDESLSDINGVQDEVADMIKEDLWANPLKYFNNEEDEDGDWQGEYVEDEINDDGENGNDNADEDSSGNGSEEDEEDEENNK